MISHIIVTSYEWYINNLALWRCVSKWMQTSIATYIVICHHIMMEKLSLRECINEFDGWSGMSSFMLPGSNHPWPSKVDIKCFSFSLFCLCFVFQETFSLCHCMFIKTSIVLPGNSHDAYLGRMRSLAEKCYDTCPSVNESLPVLTPLSPLYSRWTLFPCTLWWDLACRTSFFFRACQFSFYLIVIYVCSHINIW